MTRPLLMIFMLLLAGNLFAQSDTIDISSYKLPEIRRRQLDFNFSFSGDKRSQNNIYQQSGEKFNTHDLNSNGSSSIQYNSFLNSDKIQQSSHGMLRLNGSYSNYETNSSIDRKVSTLYSSLNWNTERRHYFNTKNFFGTNIYLNYASQNTATENTDDNGTLKVKNNSLSFTGILPIKAGRGRIEPVQDIRHALYIIDELTKQDRLSKDISAGEIRQFANLVSILKNERYFDSRLQRMHELEAVDSFLVAHQLVQEHDSRYFTVLSDFWDYGGTPARNSGNRFSLALYPGFQYLKSENTEYSTTYDRKDLVLYGGLEFIHDKPISLYWQNTIKFFGYGGTLKYLGPYDSKPSINRETPNYYAGFGQTIGYYPNTRTAADLYYSVVYTGYFESSSDEMIFTMLLSPTSRERQGSTVTITFHHS